MIQRRNPLPLVKRTMACPFEMDALSATIQRCEAITDATLDGHMNALDALAELKAIEGAAKSALSRLENAVLEEALKYGEKSFYYKGLKYVVREGSRLFKFDELEDVTKAEEALRELKDRHKDAAIQAEKGIRAVDADGQLIEPARMEFGKPSVSVK